MAVTFRKPVDDNVPWDQRLANYAGNKDAGKSEYQRALEVNRAKSALGDTAGAEAAKKWSDQVNTAIGGIGDSNKGKADDYMQRYENVVSQKPTTVTAPTPFQYDTKNIQADPIYQAALRQAQKGAQTATNNAMVGLGSRGIGNSSVAVDRANQIQQSAIGNVNDTLMPQLIEQAYNRYKDTNEMGFKIDQENYGRNNDYAGNMAGLAKAYDDRYNQQVKAEEEKRQGNIKNAMDLSNDYGFGVLPKDSGEELFKQVEGRPTVKAQTEQRQYFTDLVSSSDKLGYVVPELAQMLGIPAYSSTLSAEKEINDYAYKNGMLGVAQQNAGTSSGKLEWDMSPDNPSNQPKTQAPDTAESYAKNIHTVYDKDKKLTNPDSVMDQIELSGLPEWDKYKLYKKFNLNWDDPIPAAPGK